MTQNDQNAPMSLYGFADAATDFDQRHPQWSAVNSRLADAINLAFTRTQVMDRGNLEAKGALSRIMVATIGKLPMHQRRRGLQKEDARRNTTSGTVPAATLT
jgi:hypothetical protein